MTETTTDASESDMKKSVKEVTVVQDQGSFTHDTGDTYDGFFEAKKKDRTIKMHGPGVYKTAEGDTYSGTWENDRLGANESVSITFSDTSRYEGLLKDWCYSGTSRYVYPDNSRLECNFVENCPTGGMELTDPNGHMWLGTAEQGFGWFDPVNHFYGMLESTQEPGKKHRRPRTESKDHAPVPDLVRK